MDQERKQNINIDFGTIELKEYWEILLKRKFLFILCAIIPIVLVTAYTVSQKTIYRATCVIEVESGFQMPLNDVYQENWRTFLNTQIEMMKSDTIEKRVAVSLAEWKREVPEKYSDPDITITTIRGTSMIEIWVDSPYKEYAKAYAEALTSEFLSLKMEKKEKNSAFALVSLTRETDRLNEKVKDAQAELLKFREEHKNVVLEEYGNFSPRHLAKLATRISELETEKTLIEKQIIAL
ncbi:MAG: Wzz/FepE/Etk N-terminal domain-containing protein, partial [Candidatus Omnitrophota bacterium]